MNSVTESLLNPMGRFAGCRFIATILAVHWKFWFGALLGFIFPSTLNPMERISPCRFNMSIRSADMITFKMAHFLRFTLNSAYESNDLLSLPTKHFIIKT
ncbi:hypothetical protein CEXT_303261 [Caerostris extrusa]|uniref:Uncharacterized protein n=1 Tax=Caerostris extrusa TaxID=172846 RepID=A0AAV4WEB5_CAEEX|nr:hypothetical protein CEXT_303261 [Caerostris extrusa]